MRKNKLALIDKEHITTTFVIDSYMTCLLPALKKKLKPVCTLRIICERIASKSHPYVRSQKEIKSQRNVERHLYPLSISITHITLVNF